MPDFGYQSDLWITPVAHNHAPAYYFIFKDPNGNYNCLNQQTGLIESNNSDAATVINYALTNGLGQRIILEAGTYTLSSSLAVFQTQDFGGQGWQESILVAPTNAPCITVTGVQCSVHDLYLTHSQTSYTSALFQPGLGSQYGTYFNLSFYDNGKNSGTAIQLNNSAAANAADGIKFQNFANIQIKGFAVGINLNLANPGNYINANNFLDIFIDGAAKGITCTTPNGGSSTTNMDGNNFMNIGMQHESANPLLTGFDFTDAATHVSTALSNIIIFDLVSGNTFMNLGTQQMDIQLAGCTPNPFTQANGTINFPPAPMTANGPYFQNIYGGTGLYTQFNKCQIKPVFPFGDCVPVSPLIRKSGTAQPSANTVHLEGCLAGHTATGTGGIASAFNTTYGVTNTFNTGTTSNSNAGLVSPTTGVGIGRLAFGGRMAMVGGIDSTTSGRLYFGVTSNTTLPKSDTPLATTDSGIIVGFNTTDTNWSVRVNNGGGSAAAVTSLGVAKDATVHRFEINWLGAPAQINVIFDNTLTVITSQYPTDTPNMFFNAVVQNSSTTARTFTLQGVFVDPSA